jgi:hypothetical protein
MELKSLPPELNELRNVIISSNLTTCYLVLNEIYLKEDKPIYYAQVREKWIEMYKDVFKLISKMKARKSLRE